MLTSVLYLVGAMVAVSLVEAPLPLPELVGKSGSDYPLPLVVQFLALWMEKKNPSSFYPSRTCVRPLSSLIVTSVPPRMSLVYVLLILNPYGTLTYDALSAYVYEIGTPWMMVISGLRQNYQRRMSGH